jgi:hypothetical protein
MRFRMKKYLVLLSTLFTVVAWSHSETEKLSGIFPEPAVNNEKNLPRFSVEGVDKPELSSAEATRQVKNNDPWMAWDFSKNLVPETFSFATTVREWVSVGTVKAFQILSSSLLSSSPYASVYPRVYAGLRISDIKWPVTGYDFGGCTPGTLAFVVRGGTTIHLCSIVITSAAIQVMGLAQTLVHEAAHVAGFYNECDATKLEVSAMRLAAGGLAYVNDYVAQCGIQ